MFIFVLGLSPEVRQTLSKTDEEFGKRLKQIYVTSVDTNPEVRKLNLYLLPNCYFTICEVQCTICR